MRYATTVRLSIEHCCNGHLACTPQTLKIGRCNATTGCHSVLMTREAHLGICSCGCQWACRGCGRLCHYVHALLAARWWWHWSQPYCAQILGGELLAASAAITAARRFKLQLPLSQSFFSLEHTLPQLLDLPPPQLCHSVPPAELLDGTLQVLLNSGKLLPQVHLFHRLVLEASRDLEHAKRWGGHTHLIIFVGTSNNLSGRSSRLVSVALQKERPSRRGMVRQGGAGVAAASILCIGPLS